MSKPGYFTESLRVRLTDTEIREKGQELARASQELTQAESDKKEVMAQFTAQITARKATIANLSTIIANGYEFRPIECYWKMNHPDSGRKSIIREDTFEIVRTAIMTSDDAQKSLFADEEAKTDPLQPPDEDPMPPAEDPSEEIGPDGTEDTEDSGIDTEPPEE